MRSDLGQVAHIGRHLTRHTPGGIKANGCDFRQRTHHDRFYSYPKWVSKSGIEMILVGASVVSVCKLRCSQFLEILLCMIVEHSWSWSCCENRIKQHRAFSVWNSLSSELRSLPRNLLSGQKCDETIGPLRISNVIKDDPKEIAHVLNGYFAGIGQSLANRMGMETPMITWQHPSRVLLQ